MTWSKQEEGDMCCCFITTGITLQATFSSIQISHFMTYSPVRSSLQCMRAQGRLCWIWHNHQTFCFVVVVVVFSLCKMTAFIVSAHRGSVHNHWLCLRKKTATVLILLWPLFVCVYIPWVLNTAKLNPWPQLPSVADVFFSVHLFERSNWQEKHRGNDGCFSLASASSSWSGWNRGPSSPDVCPLQCSVNGPWATC